MSEAGSTPRLSKLSKAGWLRTARTGAQRERDSARHQKMPVKSRSHLIDFREALRLSEVTSRPVCSAKEGARILLMSQPSRLKKLKKAGSTACLRHLIAQSASGTKSVIASKNKPRQTVAQMLRLLARYVEFTSNGSEQRPGIKTILKKGERGAWMPMSASGCKRSARCRQRGCGLLEM
jgi:hypothetical protein